MCLSEKMTLIAMKSNQKTKYAAIIIHRNKVIGIGYNQLIYNSTSVTQCLLRGLQT